MMILILSLFVWSHFSTFCHELGHFVCAKLVGMTPHLVRVGSGLCIFRKSLFGAQFELRILPLDGWTFAYHPDTGWSKFEELRPKLIIFIIGGCLAESVLLVCYITMLVYTSHSIFIFIISLQSLSIIDNLLPKGLRWPFLSSRSEMPFRTDGKKILLLLTEDYQRYFFADYQADYQKEITRIAGDRAEPQTLFKDNIRNLELFVKANTELVYRHFDEAIALFSQLLNAENASNGERVYLLETLAAIVINDRQKQYLTQADGWSQEAMRLADHSRTIQGTRGAILIELGKYEEGKQLLFPLTEPDNDPHDIAISNYYLAQADHRLGNSEQAWRRFKQAEMVSQHDDDLYEITANIRQELRKSMQTAAKR
jgi:hypothetical protein